MFIFFSQKTSLFEKEEFVTVVFGLRFYHLLLHFYSMQKTTDICEFFGKSDSSYGAKQHHN